MKAPFSAVLLAGGRSTRMGRPKATLEISSLPLWRRQVELVQALGPSDLMISAGAYWSPGQGPWALVADRVPGKGPLGGLQAAFAAMATDWLLVLAVDMPAMSGDFLARLLASAGPRGVVPVVDGFYHGLAAVYPRSTGRLVDGALATDDRSLQSLVGRGIVEGLVEALPVGAADKPLFHNVNRPEDLQGFAAMAR